MERKRYNWIRREINAADRTVTFTAMRMNAEGEGEVDPTVKALVFHAAKASDANTQYAALHGFNQRIGDAAAKDAGTTTAEKFAAMQVLVDHYEAGSTEWDLPRAPRTVKELSPEAKRALLDKLAAELGVRIDG